MHKRSLRHFAVGRALVMGAVLALAVPGVAYANTVSVTVKTPGATAGPSTTFSEISTHADCSSGLVSGGGIDQAIGTGTSSNGNHVNGTAPSPTAPPSTPARPVWWAPTTPTGSASAAAAAR